jgi:hypothetical protein
MKILKRLDNFSHFVIVKQKATKDFLYNLNVARNLINGQ